MEHAVSRSTRTVASVSAAALLVAATVSGCQAGFDAFTSRSYAPSNGSVASLGDLRIRNVVIVQSADGGQSELYATVVNNGTSPDTLVTASISGFGTVPLSSGPITIPPLGVVDLGPNGYRTFVDGLKYPVGDVVTVTLRFEIAGDVHLSALIMTAEGLVSGG
jgi:copper(I)-binding protein